MNKNVHAFGIQLNSVTMSEAVKEIFLWIRGDNYDCQYVVTPNVDHIVMLQNDSHFLRVYNQASMVLVDGKPVVGALRLLGHNISETVAGSDLVPYIFSNASDNEKLAVYLLGSASGIAEKAAKKIEQKWPNVKVVGCYSPPYGFEDDENENKVIVKRINECRPDILVIGLGAPKQELWINRHKKQVKTKVTLCVGATIDFFAGEQKRAPVWMRKLALEWLYRALTNPKRLAFRYLKDAFIFPQIVWREWRKKN